jgi:hypothetical protein
MNCRSTYHPASKPNGYRIEVSGWDANECFFVEKSLLEWRESAGKKLALKAQIRIGSVLFIRLVQPLGGGTTFPTPYRAVRFGDDPSGSGSVVNIEQLQPRLRVRETASDLMRLAPTFA